MKNKKKTKENKSIKLTLAYLNKSVRNLRKESG